MPAGHRCPSPAERLTQGTPGSEAYSASAPVSEATPEGMPSLAIARSAAGGWVCYARPWAGLAPAVTPTFHSPVGVGDEEGTGVSPPLAAASQGLRWPRAPGWCEPLCSHAHLPRGPTSRLKQCVAQQTGVHGGQRVMGPGFSESSDLEIQRNSALRRKSVMSSCC